MADEEQLKILKQGVEAWNKWREENPDTEIHLEEAHLENALLKRVNLTKAHLEEAHLKEANLLEAYLFKAHFEKAHLEKTNLKGANLLEANLLEANLEEANLEDARLLSASLENANLRWAHLEKAYLEMTNLIGANLEYANLEKVYLTWANLKSANLRNANFSQACVTDVKYNRWGRYRGIRVDSCYGSPRFKRFAQDQDFIEEFRSAWWRKPIYLLWLIFADCGRSFSLWAGWSIAFALGFAYKFFSLGPGAFEVIKLDWTLETMLYYSVVTFTTLGFGDIIPETAEAARWVMAEVILGYIMLGGLISIMATKLARRS
ncbi:MAG TPA: pentapeptide repeat-containing protein [archaeon]|nr:pentapeptide repeat-containing protein [archaeon]